MIKSTTILSVRRNGAVAIGGDGQVSIQNTILKQDARKIRSLYHNKVLVGFAGATADAFALMERFEGKLEEFQGNILKIIKPRENTGFGELADAGKEHKAQMLVKIF